MNRATWKRLTAGALGLAGLVLGFSFSRQEFPKHCALIIYLNGGSSVIRYAPQTLSLRGISYSMTTVDWVFTDIDGDNRVDQMFDSRTPAFALLRQMKFVYISSQPLDSSLTFPLPQLNRSTCHRTAAYEPQFREADCLLSSLTKKAKQMQPDVMYDSFREWGRCSSGAPQRRSP